MRLADGPQLECQIEIAAAPEQVWGLVSDIATSARHSPELQEVEWLDGAEGPAVGACFSGRNRNEGLGEWHTVSRIAEIEEPRTFRWEVVYADDRHDGDPMAIWTYTLEPVAGGALHPAAARYADRRGLQPAAGLRREASGEGGGDHRRPLALLRNGIEATLSGVKAEAEA